LSITSPVTAARSHFSAAHRSLAHLDLLIGNLDSIEID